MSAKSIITACFIAIVIVILAPLASELNSNQAQRFAESYQWEKAGEKFEAAIHLDPLDASRPAAYAVFLKDVSLANADPQELLTKAIGLFRRALKLDSLNAEYAVGLADAELALFLLDGKKDGTLVKAAVAHCKLAQRNDPNGFNTAYDTGYRLMSVWGHLDREGREFATERLKYVLGRKPGFSAHIYPWVWENTRDFDVLRELSPATLEVQRDLYRFLESKNLYQFRRRQEEVVTTCREREEAAALKAEREAAARQRDALMRELVSLRRAADTIASGDWMGRCDDGKNDYTNGAMYWTGTISGVLLAPDARARIVIRARGESVRGIWPYMIVAVDGKEIGEMFVAGPEWKEYEFTARMEKGERLLSITYCNDGGDEKSGENRNLYIDEARVTVV